MADRTAKRDLSVHSVNRAVSILQVLAHRGPSTVTELGTELNLHKSTIFRLLATLEARGLVDQIGSRGRYQLGYGIVQLASGATSKLDLSVVSRRICEALAEKVGESVELIVRDGDSVLTIDQVIGPAVITTVNWVGQRTAIHATSAGKVFLAYLSADERAAYLTGSLQRFTDHTITDRRRLDEELATVRQQGYGFTVEELEIGLAAVAAPIFELDGLVVATLGISGPTFRLSAETIPALAAQVVEAAAEISRRLGQPQPG